MNNLLNPCFLAVVLPPWQFLGNIDLALSEIRSLKNEEDRAEAFIRRTVIFCVIFIGSPKARAYSMILRSAT